MIKIGLILSCLVLILSYQNCGGEYDLAIKADDPPVLTSLLTKQGGICVPPNYYLETFLIKNLNTKVEGGRLVADTDGDGISDDEELAIGTDPLNRRSLQSGKILDSVAKKLGSYDSTKDKSLLCSRIVNRVGISDCDTYALEIRGLSDPDLGLDSDKDGLLDLLELQFGTKLDKEDQLLDPDRDGVNNLAEIRQGTNVLEVNTEMHENHLVRFTSSQIENPDCDGTFFAIDIQNVPTIALPEFLDTDNFLNASFLDFSHDENENIILYYYKLIPGPGAADNFAKIYVSIEKHKFQEIDLEKINDLSNNQFWKAGDVYP